MPPSLINLPYEVISYVVEDIGIEDVLNLARTCKKLQYLEREENITRKLLEVSQSGDVSDRRLSTAISPFTKQPGADCRGAGKAVLQP